MSAPAIKIVGDVFALAKDAPTSFEAEEWLEGFEAARCMIAVRLSEHFESAGLIESASAFLDACNIPDGSPDAKFIASGFGGWFVPLTEKGTQTLAEYFDEPAAPLAPLGGEAGYVIEPADAEDVAAWLRDEGVAWEVRES